MITVVVCHFGVTYFFVVLPLSVPPVEFLHLCLDVLRCWVYFISRGWFR